MLRNSLGTRNVFYVMRLAANSLPSTMQILPVNVKDVGGSIATLVNWLSAFAVTITVNLLLEWSTYGKFIVFDVLVQLQAFGFLHLWVFL